MLEPTTTDGAACCAEVGPLLVAPGTSGRSWTCHTCGRTWSHDDEAGDERDA